MKFFKGFVFVGLALFGQISFAATLEDMWLLVETKSPENIFSNVEITTNNSIEYPAQIFITDEKSWIEVNEELKKQFSYDQFQFILYHEMAHLYLEHQKLLEQAEKIDPRSGDELRKKFVLESDQFAALIYLKFMRPWMEIEALTKKMLERNTTGEWIPPAQDRVNAINLARDFYFSKN